MICKNCGREIDEADAQCPFCEAPTGSMSTTKRKKKNYTGMAILGFLFPLIGLILYLIYEDRNQAKSKAAGEGAIVGFAMTCNLLIAVTLLFGLGAAVLVGGTILFAIIGTIVSILLIALCVITSVIFIIILIIISAVVCVGGIAAGIIPAFLL